MLPIFKQDAFKCIYNVSWIKSAVSWSAFSLLANINLKTRDQFGPSLVKTVLNRPWSVAYCFKTSQLKLVVYSRKLIAHPGINLYRNQIAFAYTAYSGIFRKMYLQCALQIYGYSEIEIFSKTASLSGR